MSGVASTAAVIHGSSGTVRQKLLDVQLDYQVDEVLVVTAIKDFPKRLHSYELLAEAMIKAPIPLRASQ